MRKMTKRSAIITGVAVAAIGVGATAWANGWGVTGEGEATANASTIQKLTATATVAQNVYPGAKSPITLTVNNPNDFPVQVTANSFKYKDLTVTGGKNPTDCKKNLTPAAFAGLSEISGTGRVPAKDSAPVTAVVTVGQLPEACAGASFRLTYDFAGTSTV